VALFRGMAGKNGSGPSGGLSTFACENREFETSDGRKVADSKRKVRIEGESGRWFPKPLVNPARKPIRRVQPIRIFAVPCEGHRADSRSSQLGRVAIR